MLDKKILEIYANSSISAEQTARTRASICTGPVFIKKDGQMVFSRQKTLEAYDHMYNIFLGSNKADNA